MQLPIEAVLLKAILAKLVLALGFGWIIMSLL
jgi:hypothetical protein